MRMKLADRRCPGGEVGVLEGHASTHCLPASVLGPWVGSQACGDSGEKEGRGCLDLTPDRLAGPHISSPQGIPGLLGLTGPSGDPGFGGHLFSSPLRKQASHLGRSQPPRGQRPGRHFPGGCPREAPIRRTKLRGWQLFPYLMGLLDPCEEPVAPSWVPDPDIPLQIIPTKW